ncbi:MAG TPA: gamma-glutamylcyclotransferase [Beijerinckiaceae bacterium]|nr:gamma-glutamylcyclotransferase [Beijerinckiaceae bacterium]
MLHQHGDLWVFGYGSLIWRPGFDYVERHRALLKGAHRSLCVYSHVHRGTRDQPGLVLGLDHGGACRGVVFRVDAHKKAETIAYLRAREQVNMVYKECVRPVALDDGRMVLALCYVVDRGHHQYAARLSREDVLRLVRQGVGQSGPNPEYVRNTALALKDLGIHDSLLDWISARV